MPSVTLVSDRGEPRIVDDLLEFEALVLRGPWRPQAGTVADAYLALGGPAPTPPSPGLPGTVADLVALPEVRAAFASLDETARGATAAHPVGNRLTKVGSVLTAGPPDAFDSAMVESLFVFRDPASGRLGGVYTGYSNTYGSPGVGSIGLAYSDDGVFWSKAGRLLAPSITAGDPDFGTLTGPVMRYEDGAYYLFYIGASAAGYEQGTKSICLATATSLAGPWTRRGALIGPGGGAWRNYPTNPAVWHPNIVKHRGTYYMFFNANNSDGKEVIGYATATSLLGPWTVDDVNSPILPLGLATSGESSKVGDPFVRRVGDMFVMDYFGVNAAATFAADYQATTSTAAFPLGWKRSTLNPVLWPTAGGIDSKFAHKPCLFVDRGKVLHYYTADNGTARQVALAVSTDPQLASAYAVLDSFIRAAASGLGTADSGQVWTTDTGWALDGTHAVWSGTADGNALIDAGIADNFAVRFRLVTVNPGFSYGVVLRYSSSSAFLKIYRTSVEWRININGTTSPAGTGPAPAAGDWVEVQVRGKAIRVLVNDVEVASFVTSAVPAAFTKHGLAGSGNVALAVERFTVRPL